MKLQKRMKNRTRTTLKILAYIILFVEFILVLAYCLYFFERDSQLETFDSYLSSIWYVLLEFTTIGYTDVTPLTFSGKFIVLITNAIGSLVGIIFLIWIVLKTIRFGRHQSNWRERNTRKIGNERQA